ncbi:sugar porter (SP) family MFS transporter [Asaia bogorensis NBRC 16594]|nr:sugar porter (SP) family MFS transporter [Asaia bogorensis NBRC 16594]
MMTDSHDAQPPSHPETVEAALRRLEKAPDKRDHAHRMVALAAAIAAIGGLLFGYDTGIIASALIYITHSFSLDSTGQQGIAAALNLGAVFGAVMSGPLSDRIGRRPSVVSAALVFILASLGCALSPDETWLIVARFALGWAIGATTQIVPVYVAELAPAERRGGLVSLFQLVFSLGLLVAFFTGYFLAGPADCWRLMFGLGVIPAILLALGMMFLPESPRWLLEHGREAQAVAVLYRLRGHHEPIRQELDALRDAQAKSADIPGWSALRARWLHPALIAAIGLAALSQLSGPNVIVYYAPIILSEAGLGHAASLLTSVGVGVTSTITTLMGIMLIDRVGRRRMLLVMLPFAALALFGLGALFLDHAPLGGTRLVLVIIALLAYIFFNFGSLSVAVWLIASEVFPLIIRSKAMGLASATVWLSDTLVSLFTLSLVHDLGRSGTFWLFGAINALAFLFVLRFVPETKGTTLEAIETRLREGHFRP